MFSLYADPFIKYEQIAELRKSRGYAQNNSHQLRKPETLREMASQKNSLIREYRPNDI